MRIQSARVNLRV